MGAVTGDRWQAFSVGDLVWICEAFQTAAFETGATNGPYALALWQEVHDQLRERGVDFQSKGLDPERPGD